MVPSVAASRRRFGIVAARSGFANYAIPAHRPGGDVAVTDVPTYHDRPPG